MLLAPVEGEHVGEHMVTAVECRGVAGLVPEAVADVAARPGAAARALAVGRGHGQRWLGKQLGRLGCEGIVEVGHSGQRFVFHLHQRQRTGRVELGVGSHGHHRVADAAHPVQSQDRLVLDEVPVAVRRHQRAMSAVGRCCVSCCKAFAAVGAQQVEAGEHSAHAGGALGR